MEEVFAAGGVGGRCARRGLSAGCRSPLGGARINPASSDARGCVRRAHASRSDLRSMVTANRSMRKFYTLLSREVRGYFHSPIAYIVLIFFLIVSGIDFYFQISFMNQRQVQYTVQEAFFNSVFFWFAFVLIFPLITMRLFAEEFKLGTIEPLTTVPVRDWQVVLSKFFGALVFYVVLWIGCLTSVLTRNQIIAVVISFCAITLLFFLGLVQFILLDVSSETRDLR